MKLRNKKTGEIRDAWSVYGKNNNLNIKYFTDDGAEWFEYHSLAELNEEWEDYTPQEPLIKDEKIRKAVRAWADLYGAKQFRVSHHDNFDKGETTSIWSTDIPTEPEIELPDHIGKDSETCTITELCGEEAE